MKYPNKKNYYMYFHTGPMTDVIVKIGSPVPNILSFFKNEYYFTHLI